MARAVLFDLDGTLLPVDTPRLIEAYVRLLAGWFSASIDPQQFAQHLTAATRIMIDNRDPVRTNRQVFAEAFYPGLGTTEDGLRPLLEAFYEREYPKLRALTSCDPAARRAVVAALDRGADAVIATNPVFPLVAIRQRLEWAGLADLPFTLVTTYETSHYCKPHAEYFLEVAAAIGRGPRDCLMVGNDVEEDAVARSVGMRTYLVTDHLTNPRGAEPAATHTGTLAELAALLAGSDFSRL